MKIIKCFLLLIHNKGADSRTDAELVAAFRNGETRCLEILFSRHRSRLRELICRTLHSNVFADDVLQKVNIKVWRLLISGHYHEEENFGKWISTLAFRECISLIRKEKHLTHPGQLPELPSRAGDEDSLTGMLREKLTGSEQQATYLHDEKGLDYDEIAEELHILPSSARRNHDRVVSHLRKLVQKGKNKKP